MQFYKKPNQNTYMFACDNNYLLNHGISCLNSAIKTNNNIHCHVLNPNDKSLKILNQIINKNKNVSLSISEEKRKSKLNKNYYAKIRFEVLEDILKHCSKIAVIDTDSIFIKSAMDIFKYDLGIHERNLSKPKERARVLAGFLLISNKCNEFIKILQEEQKAIGNFWYADQIAVARTIIKYKECQEFLKIKYCKIPLSYIDYTFQNNSYIWSGKGERKNKNKSYVAKLNQYKKTEP